MNEVMETIVNRRSTKKFKPEQIREEELQQILLAGTYAANGQGKQAGKIVVVQDPETREQLRAMNAGVMGMTDMDPFYGAPAIIIVLAEKEWRNRVYDGTLILGNMMLEAYEQGVGSCWIHRAKEEFESPEGQEILKMAGIEGEWEGIGHLAVGYIEGPFPKAPRRKGNEVYWIE